MRCQVAALLHDYSDPEPCNASQKNLTHGYSLHNEPEGGWKGGFEQMDLVLLSEADPFLSANIIRGERLYSADSVSADEYELYILRRAGDLAPLERERLDLLQRR